MPIPSNRYKIRPLRGLYSNLLAGVADIAEGEICYATDQDLLYVKEGGVLVAAGGTGDIPEAPNDGRFYVRSGEQWVNQDISLLARYALAAEGGNFDTGVSYGAYVDLDAGNFDDGSSTGEDLYLNGGDFDS